MKRHVLRIVCFQMLLFAVETNASRQKQIRKNVLGKRLRHKSGRKSKGHYQRNRSGKGKLFNETRYKNVVNSKDKTRKSIHIVKSNIRARANQDIFSTPTQSKLNLESKEDTQSSSGMGSESPYDSLVMEKYKKVHKIESQPTGLPITPYKYGVKVPNIQENDEVIEFLSTVEEPFRDRKSVV